MKHKFEVIPKEEVLNNRCNAYEFIDFDKHMKQTAVEWLLNQIKKDLNLRLRGFDIDGIGKQAKEMEKEQQGYSEEEVLKLVDNLFHKYSSDFRVSAKIDTKEWFEEFKRIEEQFKKK